MDERAVSIVRSFSRAVTLRVGSLTDSFLGRNRPLREARLLFEVGRDGSDLRELRARLDLDSGYLSRLVRSLERQGLIEVLPQASDRRIRKVRLTDDGLLELAEFDRRGDAFAQGLLDPLTEPERKRIVAAMSEVERLLNLSFTRIAPEDPSTHEARWCLEQYYNELDQRIDDGFDVSRSIPAARQELTPPNGAFLLARLDGRPIGCGAVKTVSPGVGAIKRMWVAQPMRGMGIGRRMLLALEEQANTLGLGTLRLETNRGLDEARKLYRRSGYREVPAFNDEPHADFWFQKNID